MIEDLYYNKQWGVSDFKRYHSQQMPAAERHALEKAALDDPFLEDALDGYAFAATPVEDIVELRNNLAQPKEQSRVVVLPIRPRHIFLKVAAILVLVSGLTWLLYPGTKEPSRELVATTTQTPVASEQIDTGATASVIASTQQTAAAGAPALADTNVTSRLLSVPAEKPSPSSTKDSVNANTDVATKTTEDKFATTTDQKTAASPVSKANDLEAIANNAIKGRVVDDQGAPVPYATVSVPQSNSNVASDANGVFMLKNMQQTDVLANVAAPGFETANAPLVANREGNTVVLKESKGALEEVIVLGYGTRKKTTKSVRADKQTEHFSILSLTNARPRASGSNFTDSVNRLAAQIAFADTTGYVLLRFELDANGKAKNIATVKSLSSSTDRAATQLLQNLPPLQRTHKNKPQARIEF